MLPRVLCKFRVNTIKFPDTTAVTHFVNSFKARLSFFDGPTVLSEQMTAQETTNSPAVAATCFISL